MRKLYIYKGRWNKNHDSRPEEKLDVAIFDELVPGVGVRSVCCYFDLYARSLRNICLQLIWGSNISVRCSHRTVNSCRYADIASKQMLTACFHYSFGILRETLQVNRDLCCSLHYAVKICLEIKGDLNFVQSELEMDLVWELTLNLY